MLLTADGHLKLTDFGTARLIDEAPSDAPAEQRTTRTGKPLPKRAVSFVGTADYVAPEILSNSSCTAAVDFWSLGCVVYQLICGKPPFRCAKGWVRGARAGYGAARSASRALWMATAACKAASGRARVRAGARRLRNAHYSRYQRIASLSG